MLSQALVGRMLCGLDVNDEWSHTYMTKSIPRKIDAPKQIRVGPRQPVLVIGGGVYTGKSFTAHHIMDLAVSVYGRDRVATIMASSESVKYFCPDADVIFILRDATTRKALFELLTCIRDIQQNSYACLIVVGHLPNDISASDITFVHRELHVHGEFVLKKEEYVASYNAVKNNMKCLITKHGFRLHMIVLFCKQVEICMPESILRHILKMFGNNPKLER